VVAAAAVVGWMLTGERTNQRPTAAIAITQRIPSETMPMTIQTQGLTLPAIPHFFCLRYADRIPASLADTDGGVDLPLHSSAIPLLVGEPRHLEMGASLDPAGGVGPERDPEIRERLLAAAEHDARDATLIVPERLFAWNARSGIAREHRQPL